MLAELSIAVSALLAGHLAIDHRRTLLAVRRRDRSRPTAPERYPSVTVIRPVRGTDVEQAANFRAALESAAAYPGEIETIFVLESEEDPAFPLARTAIERHRRTGAAGAARILLAGAPPPGRTGKIHNMMAGEAEARGKVIAFGDSDTRPDSAVLPNLVEHLMADDDAGAAFAPPIVPSPIRTAGDAAHHLVMNSLLVANMERRLGPRREISFVMGQLMAFRARALEAIGGSRCAEGQLVDDMYLGARLVEHGFRNVMGTWPLHVINYGLRPGTFLRLWKRWLFCGRAGIPLGFVRPIAVRAGSMLVAAGLGVTVLITGPAWAAAAPLLVVGLEGGHILRMHRACGGAPVPARYAWMAWALYPVAIAVGVSTWLRPEVEWRGRTYRLDGRARLRPRREARDGRGRGRRGAGRG